MSIQNVEHMTYILEDTLPTPGTKLSSIVSTVESFNKYVSMVTQRSILDSVLQYYIGKSMQYVSAICICFHSDNLNV